MRTGAVGRRVNAGTGRRKGNTDVSTVSEQTTVPEGATRYTMVRVPYDTAYKLRQGVQLGARWSETGSQERANQQLLVSLMALDLDRERAFTAHIDVVREIIAAAYGTV
jgi:hypothetical protein